MFTGCETAERIWNPGTVFVQNWLYWAYLIAFFTGMRHGEIAQIECEDLVEFSGVYFIDLTQRKTRVKNKASRRICPSCRC